MSGDNHIAFVQITLDNLSCSAITQPNSDPAALGFAVLALAASLVSWRADDPSLSHAVDAPVHNLMGFGGAVAADLMMQFLGLAAVEEGAAT